MKPRTRDKIIDIAVLTLGLAAIACAVFMLLGGKPPF
jgi:hypothetical protein